MASQKAIRKSYYTTSDLSSIAGRIGEFTVDITKHTIVIFDGTTVGGIPLAKEVHSHTNASALAAGFMSAADYTYLYNHAHSPATSTTAGFMSAADKAKLDGMSGSGGGAGVPMTSLNIPSTGVMRDTLGDFAAHNITANKFIGSLQGNADTVTNGVYTSGTYVDPSWITSISASKLTGTIPSSVAFSGTIPWTSITGRPSNVSFFSNDAGYINSASNITGTSGGVLSLGGRETSLLVPLTVAYRDGNGRVQVQSPILNNEAANKQYVDAVAGGGGAHFAPLVGGAWPVTSGSDIAPFDVTIVNNTEQGYIHRVLFGFDYIPTSQLTKIFLDITTDGFQSDLDFNALTWILSERNSVSFNGNPYEYLWSPELPYKTSIKLRVHTTATVNGSSPAANIRVMIYRCIRH